MDETLKKHLLKSIKQNARALGIPAGSAEIFANEAIKSLRQSLKGKSIITEADLNRLLAKTLKKYHADLAYVYETYGKIV